MWWNIPGLLVKVLQGNKTNILLYVYILYILIIYVCTHIYIHTYIQMDPSREESICSSSSKSWSDRWSMKAAAGKFPLVWGGQPFVLFRSSTGWMRPTWIIEGTLPFSKPTNLNVNLIQNTFTETSRIGAAKLTHKINDHIWRVGFHRARFRKHRFSWIIGSWNSCLPKYLD